MKKKKSFISEKLKFYGILIPALLSFAGTITVAVLQTYSAKEASLKVLVEQINKEVIPQLQGVIDDLVKENQEIKSRVERLEVVQEQKEKEDFLNSIFRIINKKSKNESLKSEEKDKHQIPKLKNNKIFQ